MVWYGDWQESRIHEELLTIPAATGGEAVVTTLGEEPTIRSGWHLGYRRGFVAVGQASEDIPGGIGEPPALRPDLSAAAFQAAMANAVNGAGFTTTSGGSFTLEEGANNMATGPGIWNQTHQWGLSGNLARLWHARNTSSGSARYAIPPGMDTLTDEYAVELDFATTPYIEVLEAQVEPYGGGDFPLVVRDAVEDGGTASFLSLLADLPTSIGSHGGVAAHAAVPLADEVMNTLMLAMLESGWSSEVLPVDAPEWPALAVVYGGPTLDSINVSITEFTKPISVRIRYRWPRWRKVYFTTPIAAPRRVFPRDDALTGGPARVYPPPKSEQRGFRVGSGSFL